MQIPRSEAIFHIVPSCVAPLSSMPPTVLLLQGLIFSNLLQELNPWKPKHSHMQSNWARLLRMGSCLHLDTLASSRYFHYLQPSLAEWFLHWSTNQHLYLLLMLIEKKSLCLLFDMQNGVLSVRIYLWGLLKVRVLIKLLNSLYFLSRHRAWEWLSQATALHCRLGNHARRSFEVLVSFLTR